MTSKLKNVLDTYMQKVSGIEEYCNRCLRTERWGGKIVLMVVDAAFTSIGLNYFTAVVPKVEEFDKKFMADGRIKDLQDLAGADINELRTVWKNRRSWAVAKDVASYLANLTNSSKNDRVALIDWASNALLKEWQEDPIGRIRGVGINTFQYLR